MTRERILITGCNGRIGTQIVPLLREHFALRLFDINPPEPGGDDEIVRADILDSDALRRACQGVTALVHLAARSDEDDFETKLLPLNLLALHRTFEAAREAGMRRIVFASTAQTVGGNSRDTFVTTDMPVRPVTVYACTKAFGEALGRFYADKHGLSVICLRIGWFQPYDSPMLRSHPGVRRSWLSPRDLTQLITRSLHADTPYGVYFGVSNNTQRHWDISNAQREIGYEPQDNAEDYFTGEST